MNKLSLCASSKGGIKEFHLFAGIGGGIYGGELLGNECCAGVEMRSFSCRAKLGWYEECVSLMEEFL